MMKIGNTEVRESSERHLTGLSDGFVLSADLYTNTVEHFVMLSRAQPSEEKDKSNSRTECSSPLHNGSPRRRA